MPQTELRPQNGGLRPRSPIFVPKNVISAPKMGFAPPKMHFFHQLEPKMSIFDPNFPLRGAEMGVWVPKWRCAALRWRHPSLRLSAPGAEWPQNGGIWPQNALFCPKTLRFEGFLPQILGSNTTIGGFLLHIAHISHPCPNMMRSSAPKWVFFPPNADFFSPKKGFFSPKC